jgi:hypothetical protein
MLCSEILATAEAGVISASALDRAAERSGAGCGDSRRQARVPEGLNARVHLRLAAPGRMWFPRPDSSLARPHSGDVPCLPGSRPPHPLEARPITRGKACYRVLISQCRALLRPLRVQGAHPPHRADRFFCSVLLTSNIPSNCEDFRQAASLVSASALVFRAVINAVTMMRPWVERW